MRTALAILFSLFLVWGQVAAVAKPLVSSAGRATCACCNCGKTDCCVTASSPASAPAPAAPVRSGVQTELSIVAATSVAWTLPATDPQTSSLSFSSSLIATGVPLFTRHCARLI